MVSTGGAHFWPERDGIGSEGMGRDGAGRVCLAMSHDGWERGLVFQVSSCVQDGVIFLLRAIEGWNGGRTITTRSDPHLISTPNV